MNELKNRGVEDVLIAVVDGLIPSLPERDSHAGDSQGEGHMIHRGKREGVCHGGCGSSSEGVRVRANTRAGDAVEYQVALIRADVPNGAGRRTWLSTTGRRRWSAVSGRER